MWPKDGCKLIWLEPSAGEGVFLSALSSRRVRPEQIYAIDLKNDPCAADSLATTKRGVDFLQWSRSTSRKFDRIVGNPPFRALNRVPEPVRLAALHTLDLAGRRIPLSSNLWYAFVCASVGLLRPGGALGMILPAAFEYAGYGASLKQALRDSFGHVEVFRSDAPLFSKVLEGSVVLLCYDYNAGPCEISRRAFKTAKGLVRGLLRSHRRAPRDLYKPLKPVLRAEVRLSDVVKVRIGAVTGHAEFFLLSDSKRMRLRLPKKACVPCLTKARHLQAATVGSREWNALRERDERVWLFKPPPEIVGDEHVRSYMSLNIEDGGCEKEGFKVRSRKPWYDVCVPADIDGFVSGMSQFGPFFVISEWRRLVASNTLYVVSFVENLSDDEKFSWALALLTRQNRNAIRKRSRQYAGGLQKIEPSALASLPIKEPIVVSDARKHYREAILSVKQKNMKLAFEISALAYGR